MFKLFQSFCIFFSSMELKINKNFTVFFVNVFLYSKETYCRSEHFRITREEFKLKFIEAELLSLER